MLAASQPRSLLLAECWSDWGLRRGDWGLGAEACCAAALDAAAARQSAARTRLRIADLQVMVVSSSLR
jgi:hypothetical protein